jgi:hypothetical protein
VREAYPIPTPYAEVGYPEPPFAAPDTEAVVEEVGEHEPLMSFPSGLEDDPAWADALDALIAARVLQG